MSGTWTRFVVDLESLSGYRQAYSEVVYSVPPTPMFEQTPTYTLDWAPTNYDGILFWPSHRNNISSYRGRLL